MPRFAENTTVSTEKSRAEIEQTLMRYGADGFSYATMGTQAQVEFLAHERRVRFTLTLPDRNADEFWYTPSRGNQRTEAQAYANWEQACRQRWRALALVVKAKLEAVEAGISEFEEEFGMWVVLPDGRTVGQHVLPMVAQAYETGDMPDFFGGVKQIGPGGSGS